MGSPAAYYSLILAITLSITGAHEVIMAFALSSTAFKDGAAIPVKHTCDGADVSPPLAWSGAPPATRTFALIADDPDAPAGTWSTGCCTIFRRPSPTSRRTSPRSKHSTWGARAR